MSRHTGPHRPHTSTHPVSSTWEDSTPVVVVRFGDGFGRWSVTKGGCPKFGNSEPTFFDVRDRRTFETTTQFGTTFGEVVEVVERHENWTPVQGSEPEHVRFCVCPWCTPRHGPDSRRTSWGGVGTRGHPDGLKPENQKGPKGRW